MGNTFSNIESVVLWFEPAASVFLGRRDYADLGSNDITTQFYIYVDIEQASDESVTANGKQRATEQLVLFFLKKDNTDYSDTDKAAIIESTKNLARKTVSKLFFDYASDTATDMRYRIVPVLSVMSGLLIGCMVNLNFPIDLDNINTCTA